MQGRWARSTAPWQRVRHKLQVRHVRHLPRAGARHGWAESSAAEVARASSEGMRRAPRAQTFVVCMPCTRTYGSEKLKSYASTKSISFYFIKV
jgi:hypothetical protein